MSVTMQIPPTPRMDVLCVPRPQREVDWNVLLQSLHHDEKTRQFVGSLNEHRAMILQSDIGTSNTSLPELIELGVEEEELHSQISFARQYNRELSLLTDAFSKDRTLRIARPVTFKWSVCTKRQSTINCCVVSDCLRVERIMSAYRLAALLCLDACVLMTAMVKQTDKKTAIHMLADACSSLTQAGTVFRSMGAIFQGWQTMETYKSLMSHQDFNLGMHDALAAVCSTAIDHAKLIWKGGQENSQMCQLVAESYLRAFRVMDQETTQENGPTKKLLADYIVWHVQAVIAKVKEMMDASQDEKTIINACGLYLYLDKVLANEYYNTERSTAVQKVLLGKISEIRKRYSFVLNRVKMPPIDSFSRLLPTALERTTPEPFDLFKTDFFSLGAEALKNEGIYFQYKL